MRYERILALIAVVLMMTVLTAAGCAGDTQANGTSDTEGNSSMDYSNVTMTDKEKDLLCGNFAFDEDRIREGQLSEAQFNALSELRLATDLLDTKYPGLGYDIINFAPATAMNGEGILDIRVDGEGDKEYKAYIIYGKDGEPYALETVYGCEVRDDYDEYLCSLLRSSGIEARAYTSFETPVANEVSRGTRPEDIIEMGKTIVRYTDIFIEDGSGRDAAVEKIKEVMQQNKIYAVYEVDFAPSIAGDIKELEAGRRNFEYASFECSER